MWFRNMAMTLSCAAGEERRDDDNVADDGDAAEDHGAVFGCGCGRWCHCYVCCCGIAKQTMNILRADGSRRPFEIIPIL